MSSEVKSGVYRHYKDGRYYQVLFTAETLGDIPAQDTDVVVFWDGCILVIEARVFGAHGSELFRARAHDAMPRSTQVVVYVPLYSDKPGRRISVRPVSEFTEMVHLPDVAVVGEGPDGRPVEQDFGRPVPRFAYIGDSIPQDS